MRLTDNYREWLNQGRAEERLKLMCEDVLDGIRTKEQAAEKAGMTLPEFEAALEQFQKENQ